MQNAKGQWNVTAIFGGGIRGLTWNHVAKNNRSGDFVDTRKFIPMVAKKTPYTAWGRAQILIKQTHSASSYAMSVDV